ncbi:hypothetical protein [Corynebacterium sp. ACRQJ]|uniref:hypothetical protein n=1 Tax=Corynebacterium sp. ACRQJ TaxID=2918189 RepID=UPI001EF734D2|nr:hypothetical protein [Corynebacterium sp. ACRQJ]MCG7267645.1 hypothetical protein [Corynebacterium sp. ACRQJ]
MKLKKSLLALTTAATVAVAGSTAAVAEEPNTPAGSIVTDNDKGGDKPGTEPGKDGNNDGKPGKKDLAGSTKFFGWDEDTKPLKKLQDVTALITAVGALVAGIVTLVNNFDKLGKLVK